MARDRDLEAIAQAIVTPGKGILAADESMGTIKKRFDTINVESTEENRRSYRELLITTQDAEKHISGVILFDETARQKTAGGVPFVQVLADKGIIPGIKVDKGAKALPFAPGEKVTEGLDGLRERLEGYAGMGLRFAKWRAVIKIDVDNGLPSEYCLDANAHALARYAALSVEQGLVPIVEPEVLMNGPHTIDDCFVATEHTLQRVYEALHLHRVPLEQTLLKPNMVLSGDECPEQAGPKEVAEKTIACFKRTVPAAVPMAPSARRPAFDERAFRARLGDSAPLFDKVVRLFLDDCPGRMRAMRQAIDAGDGEALRAAHEGHASYLPPLPDDWEYKPWIKHKKRKWDRKLAKELHPDLECDPAEREKKSRVMQEITAAYARGDLHALLQLELEWARWNERRRGSSEPR